MSKKTKTAQPAQPVALSNSAAHTIEIDITHDVSRFAHTQKIRYSLNYVLFDLTAGQVVATNGKAIASVPWKVQDAPPAKGGVELTGRVFVEAAMLAKMGPAMRRLRVRKAALTVEPITHEKNGEVQHQATRLVVGKEKRLRNGAVEWVEEVFEPTSREWVTWPVDYEEFLPLDGEVQMPALKPLRRRHHYGFDPFWAHLVWESIGSMDATIDPKGREKKTAYCLTGSYSCENEADECVTFHHEASGLRVLVMSCHAPASDNSTAAVGWLTNQQRDDLVQALKLAREYMPVGDLATALGVKLDD